MMKMANIATSSPVAWRFFARSWRSRSPSSRPGAAEDQERAALPPDGAEGCEARRSLRVSSALIEPLVMVGARTPRRDKPTAARSPGDSVAGVDEAPAPADRPIGGGEHRVGQDADHQDHDHEGKQRVRLRELPGELQPGADRGAVG